jgi:hypothetical protein
MRQTSINAYHSIKQDGTLSKKQIEVLNLVRAAGKITGRAVSRAISGGHKRLSDLRDMGAIFVAGYATDPHTKKKVILWGPTNQPLLCPPPTKRSSTSELKEEIVRLTKEIAKINERTSALFDTAYLRGFQDCANGHPLPEEIA